MKKVNKIRIFSIEFDNHEYYRKDNKNEVDSLLIRFQKDVGSFLEEHPDSSTQWLQSSSAPNSERYIQLTAIISY